MRLGDLGVVVFQGHVVPVIVADGGPFNKIGEGSMALHRALGTELCQGRDADATCWKVNRNPSSIGNGVTTIIFTGSAIPGLTAGTMVQASKEKGMALFETFRQTYGQPECPDFEVPMHNELGGWFGGRSVRSRPECRRRTSSIGTAWGLHCGYRCRRRSRSPTPWLTGAHRV